MSDETPDEPPETVEVDEEQPEGEVAGDEDESEQSSEGRGRRLLGGLVPELLKKALKEGVDIINEERLRDTVVAEVLRKAASKGGEVYDSTEDSLRKLVSELPLPKEVAERILERADDYRGELFRVVQEEVHDWLEKVDLGHEIQKILTSLSFEITTEIRFIPNEKGVPAKPDIKAGVRVKRNRKREDE